MSGNVPIAWKEIEAKMFALNAVSIINCQFMFLVLHIFIFWIMLIANCFLLVGGLINNCINKIAREFHPCTKGANIEMFCH